MAATPVILEAVIVIVISSAGISFIVIHSDFQPFHRCNPGSIWLLNLDLLFCSSYGFWQKEYCSNQNKNNDNGYSVPASESEIIRNKFRPAHECLFKGKIVKDETPENNHLVVFWPGYCEQTFLG